MATDRMGILEQRRIEAAFAKGIYEEMKAELGAETAKRITEVLSPENVAKFSAFMDSAEKSSAAVAGLIQGRRTSLDHTLASVEKATADMAAAMAAFKPLVANLDRLTTTVETGSRQARQQAAGGRRG